MYDTNEEDPVFSVEIRNKQGEVTHTYRCDCGCTAIHEIVSFESRENPLAVLEFDDDGTIGDVTDFALSEYAPLDFSTVYACPQCEREDKHIESFVQKEHMIPVNPN